ncbi:ABC transporter permease [Streptomyces sp. NPDC097619]|uniref:ABC transporter permease n=1 Tax=Streptomyces sp. NPDC097619 TaxID=3157228 RepID=UPI00332A568F
MTGPTTTGPAAGAAPSGPGAPWPGTAGAPVASGPVPAAEGREGASYLSPLPDTRPHLGHAMASEWTKLVSVRSTLWTLGSLAALVLGIGTVAALQTSDVDFQQVPFFTPALFGLFIGQVSVIVLGVLTMSSEYGTGLVRTTFTAAPDRHRVLTAKLLVFGLTAFVAVAGSVMLVGLLTAVLHSGPEAGHHGAREWIGALAGSAYVTLLGVLALAVGAMLRHSAGAIAVMLGVVTVPPVLAGVLMVWESTYTLGNWIVRYNPPVALAELFGMPMGGEFGTSSQLGQIALLVAVTAAAVAGAYVVTGRRDV